MSLNELLWGVVFPAVDNYPDVQRKRNQSAPRPLKTKNSPILTDKGDKYEKPKTE